MRLTKRQLKRIIREERSKLNRRRLTEGEFSDDPIEDAYMCVSETCEMEEGSRQIVADLDYIMEQFSLEGLLSYYVDTSKETASEEVAMNFRKFLTDVKSIQPQLADQAATAFSQFWERNYM